MQKRPASGTTKLPIGKFSYLKEEERLEQLPPIDLSLFISFNLSISTNLLTIGSYQSLWSIYTITSIPIDKISSSKSQKFL
jgi:hypothetical protein